MALNNPLPFGAEVKEKVELYLYSPSDPSQTVLHELLLFTSQPLGLHFEFKSDTVLCLWAGIAQSI
jgi:hypothetical protein